jgi:hypothetical protein
MESWQTPSSSLLFLWLWHLSRNQKRYLISMELSLLALIHCHVECRENWFLFEDLMLCCSSIWNTFFSLHSRSFTFTTFVAFCYLQSLCSNHWCWRVPFTCGFFRGLHLIHSQAQHFILNLRVLTPEPSAHVQVDFHIKIWKGASNVALCNPVCSFELWEAIFLFQMWSCRGCRARGCREEIQRAHRCAWCAIPWCRFVFLFVFLLTSVAPFK